MDICKIIDTSDFREVDTRGGGLFLTTIPYLFKGERGSLIMFEKTMIEKINNGENLPVMVREKENDKGKYFVVRTPKNGENKYRLFVLYSGGSQDHREHYGCFKVRNALDGVIICDISSSWGNNHKVIVAVKEGSYIEIEGNHGSGFKGRNPQPDFLIRLKSDGTQESFTDLDVD